MIFEVTLKLTIENNKVTKIVQINNERNTDKPAPKKSVSNITPTDFLSKKEISEMIGICVHTLTEWIKCKIFPEPDRRQGFGGLFLWEKKKILPEIRRIIVFRKKYKTPNSRLHYASILRLKHRI